MATIGGLSSGTSNSVNMYGTSIKGYGGLASGMDTDSMIEGMTIGTRTKITDLLKKKQKYQWQQDAYRSVSDKLIEFDKTYLDVASSNSPYRTTFFDKSKVTLNGANSKYLDVSGVSSALDSMSVVGIKQLAKDTTMMTNGAVTDGILSTGDINIGEDIVTSKLDGQSMILKYGTKSFTLSFKQGAKLNELNEDGSVKLDSEGNPITFDADFTTVEGTAKAINSMLSGETITGSGTAATLLSTKVKFEFKPDTADPTKGKFVLSARSETETNSVYIGGGSADGLKALGFMESDGTLVGNGIITHDGLSSNVVDQSSVRKVVAFEEYLADKSITFSYAGTQKTIKMPGADEISTWFTKDAAGNVTSTDFDAMKDYLQGELDHAFGTNRIKVDNDGNKLTFQTIKPSSSDPRGYKEDKTAVLQITEAGSGMMGENGLFGITYGEAANRINLDGTLDKSGLIRASGLADLSQYYKKNPADGTDVLDENGKHVLNLTINGKEIEGLNEDSSIRDIMRAINASDAGVKISYLSATDRFSITSTNHGAGGEIKFSDDPSGDPAADNLAGLLFGSSSDYTVTQGQDAILTVQYENSLDTTDFTSGTNTFNVDGSTFTLKGAFGFKKDADGKFVDSTGNITTDPDQYVEEAGNDRITFTTSVDADKAAEVLGKMVEDYNTMVDLVNDLVGKRPDRNYGPLSDEEKQGLSETQIKNLEDKAKEGILFNDSILRGLADSLRTVFSGAVDAKTLQDMGFTVSSSYAENGKITFNEEVFKSAFKEDPEKMKDIFTRPATATDKGGITVRLKAISHDYANYTGTKGLLVMKAGSKYSALSLLDNSMKKVMDDVDDQVDTLKKKLQKEIDRYTRQFSSLEQLIQQMNSQSGWLQQSMGG